MQKSAKEKIIGRLSENKSVFLAQQLSDGKGRVDKIRRHSPIIKQMGKEVIVESKSVAEFIRQMMRMGEDGRGYETLYGYSIGITEKRFPLYRCPKYDFEITDILTNLKLENLNRTNR